MRLQASVQPTNIASASVYARNTREHSFRSLHRVLFGLAASTISHPISVMHNTGAAMLSMPNAADCVNSGKLIITVIPARSNTRTHQNTRL